MEITSFDLYLFTRLEPLKAVIDIVGFFILIGAAIGGIFLFLMHGPAYKDKDFDGVRPWFHRAYICIVLIGTCLLTAKITIPTTKEAAVIWLLPKLAKNERLVNMPDKALQLTEEWLMQTLKDLKNNAEDKK